MEERGVVRLGASEPRGRGHLDPIVPGEIDRGGVINTIVPRSTTSKNVVGMAVSGFLAEVEKTDMEEMRRRYPEPFARECHPAAGPCLAGVLMEGVK